MVIFKNCDKRKISLLKGLSLTAVGAYLVSQTEYETPTS